VLGEPRYLDAAREAAEFVWDFMRDGSGRLLRTFNDGAARLPAYLEDHAYLLEGLLTLYEATFDEVWFVRARSLADTILERFADPDRGGFFVTADDGEPLLTRRKDLEDTPIPSGSSSAALGLLRLAALTGEARYEEAALGAMRLVVRIAPRFPSAFGHLLCAIDLHAGGVREVAIAGRDTGALLAVVRERFRPRIVLAGGAGGAVPLLEGRVDEEGPALAYVCERFACQAPVGEPAALRALLDG